MTVSIAMARQRYPVLFVAFGSVLLGLLLSITARAAVPPIELTPQKVSAHVYFFRGESGVASAANRGYIANAGFVVTGDGVVVFDALGSPVLGDAMIRAIHRVTTQPIRRLILSHYHADHFYGAQSFKAIGVDIWAGEKGRAYLESDLAQQRLQERRHDLAPDVDANTRLVPADRWLSFPGGRPIDFSMGGLHFRIIDVGGAHSPEDLMLFVDEDKVLFAGDLFFTGRIPYVGNADSRAWLAALGKMAPLHARIVLPGHGDLSTDPDKDVSLTRDYLLYLREKMGSAARDLTDFDEAYAKVDWSRFAAYPAFAQANRLNAYGTYLLMQGEYLNSAPEAPTN
ncbi:MAG: MBL fold metallo-hydrolase [Burkholderiaceae bacterium]